MCIIIIIILWQLSVLLRVALALFANESMHCHLCLLARAGVPTNTHLRDAVMAILHHSVYHMSSMRLVGAV